MTTLVLLRLDWPSPKLNPNNSKGRSHWYNQKERKAAKQKAWGEALNRGVKNLSGDKFTLKATAYPPTRHKRDDDNFLSSLKWHRDGIAAAMGVDDSAFTWEPVEFVYGAEAAGVLIEVRGQE